MTSGTNQFGMPDPHSTDPNGMAERAMALGRRLAATRGGATIEIATTPKDEIWRDGKIRLYRYRPRAESSPHLGPMLILHGLIGRQSMTDLEPDRSLVLRMLEAGVDLYVVDWGNPDRAEQFSDFTDYAEHHLGDAISAVQAEIANSTSHTPKVALLGICQGGVFAACHAARHHASVLGLVLTVTPIDFHADADTDSGEPGRGLLNLWVRSLPEQTLIDLIDERGNLSGQLTGDLFQQLAPARTLAKYTSGLASLAGDTAALETFLRMEKWLADRPDHPGAAAKEWLIDLYQKNQLVRGEFLIAGEPIDLTAIECPVLNIFGARDHIIPPPCSRALGGILSDHNYTELEVPTGHVGVFVSNRAQQTVAPAITRWLDRIG